jgi:imidazolonepropionase-like amidohydrolase
MTPAIKLTALCALFALAATRPGAAQDPTPESRPESRPGDSRPTDETPSPEGGRRRRRMRPDGAGGPGGPGGRVPVLEAAAAETRPESGPTAEKAAAPAESRPASPFSAVVDGIVYTVSGPVLRRGVVLMKDDKIVEVGRDVAVPPGAKIYDAKGKHVIPGLVALASFGTFSSGFTPRGEEKSADQADPFNQRMLMALSSGITTACEGAVQGGPGMFGGIVRGNRGGGTPIGQISGFVGKHAYGTVEGIALKDGVALVVQYGASEPLSKAQTEEAIAKAVEFRKRRGEAAADPAKRDQKAEGPDETTRNWVRVLDGELPCFITAEDKADLLAVAELAERFSVPVTVLGGREAWTVAPRLAGARLSFILNPRVRDSSGDWANPYGHEPNGWSVENAAKIAAAGMRFAVQPLQSSVGTGGLMGRDLLQLNLDAAFTVRGGVSDAEALASVTLRAAQMIRVDHRVGSLEAGKDADLVVMDLDPLDYRSFAEHTFVNGRLVYEKDKVSFFNHVQTDRSKGLKGSWANER